MITKQQEQLMVIEREKVSSLSKSKPDSFSFSEMPHL